MADNLTTQSSTLATVPASSVISTEEITTLNGGAVSAQHVQRVGIASRTADGTAIDLPGTTADGLLVNLGGNNDVTVTGDVAITAAALPLPSGAATAANQSTANTSLASIDGKITAVNTGAVVVSSSALPSGASTAAKQPALGTAGSASTDVITVQGIASMTALKVDGSAVTQPVSGTVTASLAAGTNNIGDVDVLSIAAGDNNIGNVDIVSVPAPLSTTGGGTEATALRVTVASDSTGILSVDDNGGALTVDNAGTFAVQVDGNALTALQLIDDPVFADKAAFTLATSKVMVSGGYTVAHGSAPDAADAGKAVAPLMNRHRIPFTLGGHPNVKTSVYIRTDAGTDDNIMPAISSGTKYAITKITCTLDEACTVGVAVRIGFGTANVPALGSTGADAVDDVLAYHPGMVPGSIYKEGDGSGILGVGGDGAELRITNEVPTGGTLGVLVTWFPIES